MTKSASCSRESLTVIAATLVAAGCALARDLAAGRELGLSSGLDTWVVAIALTGVLASATTTGLGATVLPAQRRAASETNTEALESQEVAAAAISLSVTFGVGAGIAAFLLADLVASLASSGDSDLGVVIRALALTTLPALIIRGSASSLLQARQRFAIAGLSPAVPSLIVLVAILIRENDVVDLAVAQATGSVVEAATLITASAVLIGLTAPPVSTWRRLGRNLLRGVAPAFVGGLAFSLSPVVDLLVASRLGPGEAGQLGLASRLTIAGAALAATALATPAYPRMVDALASGGPGELHRLTAQVARRGIAVGAVLSALIGIGTFPAIGFILSGNALSSADATAIARLQAVYAFVAAPYIVTTVALRALHALGLYRTAMAISLAAASINLLADVLLSSVFGVYGIALATSGVYLISASLMLLAARNQALQLNGRSAVDSLGHE